MAAEIPQDVYTSLVRAMASIPAVIPPELIVDPGTTFETCACGKHVSVSRFTPQNTGAVIILNNVCSGCKDGAKLDREHAKFVCSKCKKVILRIEPCKDKHGFEFKAGHTYHLTHCGSCNPDDQEAGIIEKQFFERLRKK